MSRLACSLLLAALAVPLGAQTPRPSPADSARAAREATRDAARDAARAERDARRAERDARDADEDLAGIGEAVGTAVREGLRSAAEALRGADLHVAAASVAASGAMRSVAAGMETALADVAAELDDVGRELRDELRDERRDTRRARDGQPSFTRIDTTVSTGAAADVDLSMISGPVTVTTWDRNEVRVRGQSRRPMYFEHRGASVRVWLERGNRRDYDPEDQRLEVVVPANSVVEANSVSGDVKVTGVRGEVNARAVSGDVEVRGAARRTRLSSVSGDVVGAQLGEDVRAKSVSGDVSLDDVGGEVEAETVSGEIEVRRSPRVRRMRAQSVSGEIGYDGGIARDGRYEFNSHSGEIRLALPADVGASLALRTFSGSIDSAFPLTLQPAGEGNARSFVGGRGGNRSMEFTLGQGGARITAETFSGTITLARTPR